VEEETLN